jgi:hypothetical protein
MRNPKKRKKEKPMESKQTVTKLFTSTGSTDMQKRMRDTFTKALCTLHCLCLLKTQQQESPQAAPADSAIDCSNPMDIS